ncbi:MAG: hypothetical protein ACRCYV_04170 [Aeromonas sp.]
MLKILLSAAWLIGCLGAAAITYGSYLYAPALGWGVGGGLGMIWSLLCVRAIAKGA